MISAAKWPQKRWVIVVALIFIFLLALALRFPGFLQEIEPFHFCDEDQFVRPAYYMLRTGVWQIHEFHSGGINFYF